MALRRENERPWHEVEQDFLECEYRAVRDRQMKELEMEDDIMAKVPMRYVSHVCALTYAPERAFAATSERSSTRSPQSSCGSSGCIACWREHGS